MIDRSPKVVLNAIDLYEDLIQVPLPLSVLAHENRSLLSDFASECRAKSIDPESHALVANVDAALVEQVLDIAK